VRIIITKSARPSLASEALKVRKTKSVVRGNIILTFVYNIIVITRADISSMANNIKRMWWRFSKIVVRTIKKIIDNKMARVKFINY
jgi:hypothetical protein